ncbi:3-oxo-5-alpha-steroid 4-dehydrogenase [Blumeria hordei DH14]|uniref:3-oxo-5-alpha-steroid 4-dehydrogenase n=1 Tax=Blumeria graminis f. sp. hordei (strain DH14) TaxID=546991 RepID=N1JC87_BLUG1|nr:3-oxo-5-alpha-steroid 4-dehydrogenase [Blumeria hordei DH14]
MILIPNILPPSRQTWVWATFLFQFFPVVLIQWFVDYYPAGKTSVHSRWNLPGKLAWATMEVPGFLTLLYCLRTLPPLLNITELPIENRIMASMFVIHYIYRALLAPFLNPSMSPIHLLIWASAVAFQLANGLVIGGYLAGYGPTTSAAWLATVSPSWLRIRMFFGFLLWLLGFSGNIIHDEILRNIRRSARYKKGQSIAYRKIKQRTSRHPSAKVSKVYELPQKGLFSWILFPHYFCEWVEWAGWWLMGGTMFVPGRIFLFNEIATMTPRAIQGREWYIKKFGQQRLQGVKAIIPGIL